MEAEEEVELEADGDVEVEVEEGLQGEVEVEEELCVQVEEEGRWKCAISASLVPCRPLPLRKSGVRYTGASSLVGSHMACLDRSRRSYFWPPHVGQPVP